MLTSQNSQIKHFKDVSVVLYRHICRIKTVSYNVFKLGMLLKYDDKNILSERKLVVTDL